MIHLFMRAIWLFRNRDYIRPLPRGMLATHYDSIPRDYREVMARLGIRDPIGITLAMKRYQVDNIADLIAALEYYRPRRRMLRRLQQVLGRGNGGTEWNPHERELITDGIEARKHAAMIDIYDRLRQVENFKGGYTTTTEV